MKCLIAMLALLPFAATAQKANVHSDVKLKSFQFSYDSMVINCQNVMVNNKPANTRLIPTGPGIMNFPENLDRTAPDWTHCVMTARCVRIKCPAYPDLRGDMLVYDNVTDKAILSGHVAMIDHDVEKQLAQTVYLDFSDDNYKIEGLN